MRDFFSFLFNGFLPEFALVEGVQFQDDQPKEDKPDLMLRWSLGGALTSIGKAISNVFNPPKQSTPAVSTPPPAPAATVPAPPPPPPPPPSPVATQTAQDMAQAGYDSARANAGRFGFRASLLQQGMPGAMGNPATGSKSLLGN